MSKYKNYLKNYSWAKSRHPKYVFDDYLLNPYTLEKVQEIKEEDFPPDKWKEFLFIYERFPKMSLKMYIDKYSKLSRFKKLLIKIAELYLKLDEHDKKQLNNLERIICFALIYFLDIK